MSAPLRKRAPRAQTWIRRRLEYLREAGRINQMFAELRHFHDGSGCAVIHHRNRIRSLRRLEP